MADLNTDVRYIKGIGEQRAKALGKLGIATLRDLISYFPRAYDDRSALRRIADLVPGETAGVAAMVASPPTISHIRKGLDLVKLRAVDDTGTLDVTFFNQAWLKNSLHQGETYIFYGRAEGSLLRHQMANPVVEPEGRREVTGRIVPIYPLTAGVSQLILSRSIRQGLDACADILPDVLPDRVRRDHQLCRIEYAYENIHFPESVEALDLARRRLAFEELFLFTIGLERLRSRWEVVHVPPCGGVDMELFYRALPFTLTDAQRRCVEEALADMRSGTPMNRLCQGDVGSGKTMVAAACVWFAARNGWQSALMAPTEILARQHYENLAPLFARFGLHCALLTGSTRARERRAILAGLADGTIDLCIGTHALLTEDVQYARLGLVITDEQHRFGVAQRAALAAKGRAPGISRDFAAMQWAWLPAEIWPQAREEARAREFHGDYRIFASDMDPRAVAMARDNARRAGVNDCITFAVADARDFDRTTDRGVIVTNPPYGERLMEKREAEALYTAFGAAYARTEHWRLYLLSSHTEFERAFGRPADKKRKLYNGTLRCDLFQYTRDV